MSLIAFIIDNRAMHSSSYNNALPLFVVDYYLTSY
jgi:hypothetical protein